ncbi:MAG: NUDIX hydrolase, partial [Tumebacillaceae bacterium]
MSTKIVYQNPKYQVLEGENNSVYLRQPKFQYATIIAIHESRLVMVKQYREGVQRDVYELPGGGVEEGEDFETAARREL